MEHWSTRRTKFFRRSFNALFTKDWQKNALGLSIGLILLIAQLFFYLQTESLLLFCAVLIQFSLLLFLLPAFFRQPDQSSQEIRLGAAFLNGLIVFLWCIYIFLESFSRLNGKMPAAFSDAWLPAFLCLGGNLFVFFLLHHTRLLKVRFGSFRPPVPAMIVAFGLIFLALVFIQLTDMYLLDSLVSILLGISMFVWAIFATLDAHWKILEFASGKTALL